MGSSRRLRPGAVVAALALVTAVFASAATGDPVTGRVLPAPAATPTPGPSVPSAAELATAKAAAAAAAKEVADITAQVEVAQARLETLQRQVAVAVATQEQAAKRLADAEAAVEQATTDLLTARRARAAADSDLSASAALIYMQGGDLQNLTTVLLSPPGVASDLAVVLDQNARDVRANLDSATSAAVRATAKERVLESVRANHDTAAAQAGAQRTAVEAQAARAGAEAAKLGTKEEELTARLDQLTKGVSDLVGQREAAARLGQFDVLGLQAAGGAPRAAQELARPMVAARGWGPGEFTCLVALWNAESGWSWSAANPSSGAYGIPQALPGWKMASAGNDWLTNPATQISWGLGYIASTYGSPCRAHDAFLARSPHWY